MMPPTTSKRRKERGDRQERYTPMVQDDAPRYARCVEGHNAT
jgi:hypothetical protein